MAFPAPTQTTSDQREVELSLLRFLRKYHPQVNALWGTHPDAQHDNVNVEEKIKSEEGVMDGDSGGAHLHRALHESYVHSRLLCLAESTQGLYSAQPWLAYWTLQAADVLDITDELYEYVSPDALGEFLLACLQEVDNGSSQRKKQNNDNSRNNNGNSHDEDMSSASDGTKKTVTLQQRPCPLPGADEDDGERVVGFAGGRCAQIPHLAASYAAVCSLCILARPAYLRALPRAAIKRWLLSLRCDDGSFRMHVGGEADIRASYCVAVMVVLLQLGDVTAYTDGRDETVLTPQTAAFVASCQTHEGGFACGQGASEAHGAYTQCGLAALVLMRHSHLCNYTALRRWLAVRQLKFEGGFNGRTNKLVDSCYSHWVGASHVLLRVGEVYAQLFTQANRPRCLTAVETLLLDHAQLIDVSSIRPADDEVWQKTEEVQQQRTARVEAYLNSTSSSSAATAPMTSMSPSFFDVEVGDFYFNQRRLLLYVLSCCQDTEKGGLMDKPLCPNDAYHTCYALSGMSSAQNLQYMPHGPVDGEFLYATALRRGYIPGERNGYGVVLACKSDTGNHQSQERLQPVNPIFNLHRSRVLATLRVWGMKSFIC